MRNKRNVLSAVLAALLCLALLVGCANNNGNGGNAASGGSGGNGGTAATEGNAGGDAAKPKLRVLAGYGANIDPNSDLMAKEITARTGYEVEYSMLPQTQANEKLSIEVASGTAYDIIKVTPNQFYTLVSQGALQPIGALLDEHGANIKAAMLPETWSLAEFNGEIYGIPQKNEQPFVKSTLLFREDVLTELGLPKPETADDLYNTLKAVKAAKPDMIPYSGYAENRQTGSGSGVLIAAIGSAFGIYSDWMDIDGKLVPRIQLPGMRDYLAFMQKLYKEDLLDQDWAINKLPTIEEKFVSGKAFMINFDWLDATRIYPGIEQNVPQAKLGLTDPLKDAAGNAGIHADYKLNSFTVIPKSAKNAVDAIKFLDAKLSDDHFEFLAIGEEGKHFNKEDGKYVPIMPIFTEERNNAFWFLNGVNEYEYGEMWLARIRRDANMASAYEQMNERADLYRQTDPTSFMPPMGAVSDNIQALNKMEEDYFIRLLLEEDNLDSFDGFLANWGKAGGDAMVQAVNEWYATVKK